MVFNAVTVTVIRHETTLAMEFYSAVTGKTVFEGAADRYAVLPAIRSAAGFPSNPAAIH